MKDGLEEYLDGKGMELAKERAQLEVRGAESRLKLAKIGRIVRGQGDIFETTQGVVYPTAAAKKEHVKKREEELLRAKERLTQKLSPVLPKMFADALKVDQVGELEPNTVPGASRGTFSARAAGTIGLGSTDEIPPVAEVLQVIDKQNVLVLMGDVTLWLETDTKGLADGATMKLAGICWHVVGTKTYDGVDGAQKTVYHLKPIAVK